MAQTRRCDWTLATVLPGNLPGFVAYLSPDNLAETSIFAAPNAGGAAYDDGRDIRAYAVIDGEPVRIPVEIHFNRYAQIGRIWARFPNFQLSPTLRIEWGDPDLPAVPVTDTYGRNAVWQDYALVIHATEDGSTAADSTGKSTSVTVEGGGLASATVAHPGGLAGWKFDGVDDRITLPIRDGLRAKRPFTVQAWIAATAAAGDDFVINTRWYPGTNAGWGFRRVGGATSAIRYTGYSVADVNSTAGVVWGAAWHAIAFSANGSVGKFFNDGSQLGANVTLGAEPSQVTTNDLSIGWFSNGSNTFWADFNLAEVRIAANEIPAAVLAAEYANQSNPLSFWGAPVETDLGGRSEVSADAALPLVALTAPAAAAVGNSSADAALPVITVASPSASAAGGASVGLPLPVASILAPAATAAGAALANGALPVIEISAPHALATGGGAAVAAASLPAALISPPAAYASGGQSAMVPAGLPVVVLRAPAAVAAVGAGAAAELPVVVFSALAAQASGGAAIVANAALPAAIMSAPVAVAAGVAVVSTGLPAITVRAPEAMIGKPYVPAFSRMAWAQGERGSSAPAGRGSRAVRF